MKDADGNESSAVSITLKDQKNGKFTVEVSADKEWLNVWGRKFPVTVDPELNIGGTTGNVSSTNISSANPDVYYGMSTSNSLGNSTQYGKMNTLYKIDSYPTLATGDEIISASFRTYGASNSDMTVTAHQITSDWTLIKTSPIRATWNNTSYNTAVLDYVRYQSTAEPPFALVFDITKLAKEWYDGTAGKYGIALSTEDNDVMTVTSAYSIYTESRPVFTIIYKNYTGTEPTLTYHTHPVGTNGEGSISDYLGSLSYKQSIYESTGSRMPVTITATYNSILKDKVFGNNSASGYGWQFSFNQYIDETSSSLQSAGYPYVYTDEDGTQHYFKQKEDSTTEWEDEDGLNLTLTKDSNYVYIKNQDEMVQKYALPANGGNLLTETDRYNNARVYTYNTDKNLTKITDGAGRVYTLTYTVSTDTNKKHISKITVPDGKAITFDYNYVAGDKDRLLYVRYPGSRTYTFTYAADGNLSKITAPDTTSIKYTFTDDKVTQVAEYGKQNTAGNYLNIVYNSNNTTTYTDR